MDTELMIGAVGWEHPAWDGLFYPDDLPPEWRLTYYANEFPSLLLPVEAWLAGDRERFCGWREDVSEQFRFVLDVSGISLEDASAMKQLQCCQAALGDRLAGAVCWSPPSRAGSIRLRTALGDSRFLAMAVCVSGMEPGVQVAEDGAVLCILVAGDAVPDLKWLRSVLESLSARIGAARSPMLFFSGRPPPIKVMRETAVLWRLLGGLQR